MPITLPEEITIASLTEATVDGDGIFDVLMRATKEHLEQEFNKNRIRGPEYSTVYLGSLQQVMNTAMSFLLAKNKMALEAQLLEQQILLAQAQVLETNARIALTEAQVALAEQQAANLVLEGANIPKQGAVLDAQASQIAQQTSNLADEALNIPKQGELIDAQTANSTQQTLNLVSEKLRIDAQTSLLTQQEANAVIEGTVLVAQECKLRAEFDLLVANTLKAAQEQALLTQKVATERAQILSTGVDGDSVVGRQKALYVAQTNGFTRDAEQKAAKAMIDAWSVQRTTDDGLSPAGAGLGDANIVRAVNKLLAGIGA